MKITQLKIEGSWQIEFNKFSDDRGYFFESFKSNFSEEKRIMRRSLCRRFI